VIPPESSYFRAPIVTKLYKKYCTYYDAFREFLGNMDSKNNVCFQGFPNRLGGSTQHGRSTEAA
jgi:hypothetical protein